MEIAILVALFLIGTVAGAMQAMKYLERRSQGRPESNERTSDEES